MSRPSRTMYSQVRNVIHWVIKHRRSHMLWNDIYGTEGSSVEYDAVEKSPDGSEIRYLKTVVVQRSHDNKLLARWITTGDDGTSVQSKHRHVPRRFDARESRPVEGVVTPLGTVQCKKVVVTWPGVQSTYWVYQGIVVCERHASRTLVTECVIRRIVIGGMDLQHL